MKISYILLVLLFISLNSTASSKNYQSPWKSSHYLYADSTPSLNIDDPLKLFNRKGYLYLCGKKGVMLFKLDNKTWKLVKSITFSVTDAALGKNHLALATAKGIVLLDPKSGKILRKSNKLPVNSTCRRHTAIFALPDGCFIIFMINTLYRYNPANDKLVKLKDGLKNKISSFAALKDKVYILNDNNLFCYNNKKVVEYKRIGKKTLFPGSGKNIFTGPTGKYLLISSTKPGITLLDPDNGKIIDYTGRKNSAGLRLTWWGGAVDKLSNILYIPGWDSIAVIANANTPEKWHKIGELGPCDTVPLYTYKCVYPCGKRSILYLPETQQLVFANKCGISILNSSAASFSLPKNENFSKFELINNTVPGKGSFYDWLRKEKLRAMYATSSSRLSEEDFKNYAKLKVNALIYNIFNIEHGQFYPPHNVRNELARLVKICNKNKVKLFAHLTPYNISINNSTQLKSYEYRKLICTSGQTGRKLDNSRSKKYPRRQFPCYYDKEYLQRAGIAYQLKELAKLSREIKLQGVCFELGDGFLGTNIKVRREPCFCNSCWVNFLDKNSLGTNVDRKLPPKQRYRRLLKLREWKKYLTHQRRALVNICKDALLEARKINPELVIILMLPETAQPYPECWFYNAFIEGFSSKEKPVLVASEQTYGSPYMPKLVNKLQEQWKNQGLPVIMIPGISYFWMNPKTFSKRSQNYLKHCAGIYIYHGNSFSNKHLNKNAFKPLNNSVKVQYMLSDYLKENN